MPANISYLWLLPLAAYLVGSLSPAYFAGRLHGLDLREHGSKSLGATNAGRVLGGRWFFIVFIADVLKGWCPASLAKLLTGSEAAATPTQAVLISLATGAAVVLGHIFTCFHRFRGGKAVATSLGVLVALMPLVAGLAFAAWLLAWLVGWGIVRAKKSSSVGPASVLAAIAAPIIHVGTSDEPWAMPELAMTVFIIALAILIIVKHRSNLARMAGASAAPSA
jgi:glycerol-3-phosphate acyltransferase PlsY